MRQRVAAVGRDRLCRRRAPVRAQLPTAWPWRASRRGAGSAQPGRRCRPASACRCRTGGTRSRARRGDPTWSSGCRTGCRTSSGRWRGCTRDGFLSSSHQSLDDRRERLDSGSRGSAPGCRYLRDDARRDHRRQQPARASAARRPRRAAAGRDRRSSPSTAGSASAPGSSSRSAASSTTRSSSAPASPAWCGPRATGANAPPGP